MVEHGDEESSGAVENNPRDSELCSEAVGPAEEEIGEDGHRWVRVGVEPLDDGILELAESGHDRNVAVVTDVFDVLDAGRNGRVVREREN